MTVTDRRFSCIIITGRRRSVMEVMSGVICLMIPAVFIVSCIYFILEQSKEWKKK